MNSQQQQFDPVVEVSLLLPERSSSAEHMLLRIQNMARAAVMVCIRSSQYLIGDSGRGEASPHRCNNNTNFTTVLANESYIMDTGLSIDIHANITISIDTTVIVRSLTQKSDTELNATWKGTAQQARDAFQRLTSRK